MQAPPWPNSDVTAFVNAEELVGTHLMTNSGLPRFLLSSPEMKALRGFSDRFLSVCKGVFSCSNEGPHLFPRGGSYEIVQIQRRNFKNLERCGPWASLSAPNQRYDITMALLIFVY